MTTGDFSMLNEKRAVVTGASSGIGQAIAVELARAGADVVLHFHQNRDGAEATAHQIQELGHRVEVIAADLSRLESVTALVGQAWDAFEGIDIWVNNAGADLLTGVAARLDYTDKLQRLLDIDVRAGLLLARHVGQRMAAAEGGVILNTGWDQADRGMSGASGELFAAAKNAMMGFTRSLALSLAPHVRVNCIAPGWIRTAWGEHADETWHERVRRETPLGRWGTPQDVAKLARFLVSDEAGYITGQVINVNGGAIR